MASTIPSTGANRAEERKVLAGTMVGTTIEWYDFFIYAQAAGLVLAPLFLAPVSQHLWPWLAARSALKMR